MAGGRLGARFRQQEDRRRRHHAGEHHLEAEDPAPAAFRQHPAAEQGGEDRRHAHHQGQHGEDVQNLAEVEPVPHDGPGDHHAAAAGQGLGDAQHQQHRLGGGQGAADGGEDIAAKADQQRRAPPDPVRQGSVDKLADRHADKEHRHGLLHRRRGGVQAAADGGQRRQIHVDGQRSEGGQAAKQKHQPQRRLGGARQSIVRRGEGNMRLDGDDSDSPADDTYLCDTSV
jgi:hypothetical protein